LGTKAAMTCSFISAQFKKMITNVSNKGEEVVFDIVQGAKGFQADRVIRQTKSTTLEANSI
jgi:hypothetical protein